MTSIAKLNEHTSPRPLGQFRPEIAGLRAVAVTIVVLCHLKIPYFDGGFVGVDIFFVISGFLISKHIVGDLERGTFRYLDFSVRRMRRILPALICILCISFFVGAIWLDPQAFRGLAKETTHALLSIANIQYWREAHEYFAPAAENLPLLHTWSLSVEEQFYLCWPAFLFLSYRRFDLRLAVIGLGVLSLLACLITMRHDSQAAFFLTPFRVFEFCIGASCALYERRLSDLIGSPATFTVSGLLAIASSLILFSSQTALPGIGSLLPCFGAAFIIIGGNRSQISRCLTSPASQYVGLISYSFYLCHWPVLFFTRYIFGPSADTWTATLVMVTVMLAIASAMERFVERPFRTVGVTRPTRSVGMRFVFTTMIFAALTHIVFLQNGWAWRLSQAQLRLANRQSFGVYPCNGRVLERCEFGSEHGQRTVEIIGDSYAHQYVSGLDSLLKLSSLSGAVTIIGGCPMLLDLTSTNPGAVACRKAQRDVFEKMAHTPPSISVVLAQAWSMYTDEYTVVDGESTPSSSHGVAKLEEAVRKTVALLSQNGRRVMIIGSQVTPNCVIDKSRLPRGPLWRATAGSCFPEKKEEVAQRGREIDEMLQRVQLQFPRNVSLLKPVDRFCETDVCPIIKNGEWLFIDRGHFSVAGSKYMVERASAEFVDVVRGRGAPPR